MFEELIQPVKTYTGWDESKIPIQNMEKVEKLFGEKTVKLTKTVRDINNYKHLFCNDV